MTATLDGAAPFELVDPTKVGYGAATLWLAAIGTAMPADTVNMGEDWRTTVPAWSPIGSTEDGIHYGSNPVTNDLSIEESPIPAAVLIESMDFPVSCILAEDVLANVRIAAGIGTIVTTAAGASGQIGKSVWTPGLTPLRFALGIEHMNPTGHWTRVSVPNVMSANQWTADNRRAASKRMYAAQFRAVCLPSQITRTDKTAESTS